MAQRLGIAAVSAVLCSCAAAAQDVPFDTWRAGFEDRAVASGRDAGVVRDTLKGVEPNERVIELDRNQPEFTRAVWDYLATAVSETRVETAKEKFRDNADLLSDIETYWRVDSEILVAIWGLESAYGQVIGNDDVVQSLATLAWEGRRRALFESELFAVFDILKDGAATRDDLIGGWAGAMGQTQFMPTTYVAYAVDHDRDGRKDLWKNTGDALASAARYLNDRGWNPGEPWGVEVALPDDFDYGLADGRRLNVGGWARHGVLRLDHEPWPASEQFRRARLLLPAGARGPAFLTFDNFDVIKRYNNSTSYALAAGLLSNALAGRPGVAAAWPTDERMLSRAEVIDMQRLLTSLGHDTQGADGLVGPNTRDALRAWQAANGLAADAFPTGRLLEMMRAQAG